MRSSNYPTVGKGFRLVTLILAVLFSAALQAETERAFLGVTVETLDKDEGGHGWSGVRVARVIADSSAAKAGFEKGDVILYFNEEKIRRPANLLDAVADTSPGDRVKVIVLRNEKKRILHVEMGKSESFFGNFEFKNFFSLPESVYMGVYLQDLNSDLAAYFSVKEGDGVLILRVEEDSPADEAGIRAGDILLSINGEAVSKADGAARLIAEQEAGEKVRIEVVRHGKKERMLVELAERKGLRHPGLLRLPAAESCGFLLKGFHRFPDRLPVEMNIPVITERMEQLFQRLHRLRRDCSGMLKRSRNRELRRLPSGGPTLI